MSRFEVCYKGEGEQTWMPIPEFTVRARMARNYKDVDAVMTAIDEGQVVQTNFARYRLRPPVAVAAEVPAALSEARP